MKVLKKKKEGLSQLGKNRCVSSNECARGPASHSHVKKKKVRGAKKERKKVGET